MSTQNDTDQQIQDEYRHGIYICTITAPLLLLFSAWFSPNPLTLNAWLLWGAWFGTLPIIVWMHYITRDKYNVNNSTNNHINNSTNDYANLILYKL